MTSQGVLGDLCDTVQEIVAPHLSSFDLNGFSYSRVFRDGSRSELWNNSGALFHTFFEKKYLSGLYTPNIYLENERYVFLPSKIQALKDLEVQKRYELQLRDQKEIFDHDNCFVIVRKSVNMCEYFIFYSTSSKHDAINFYLNSKEKLEIFCNYFLEKSKKIISIADLNKIKKENQKPGIKNYYNNSTSYFGKKSTFERLSKRQQQISRLVLEGKTACESAAILGLSKRTVEYYIDILKNMFGCQKKFELSAALYKYFNSKE